MSYRAWLTGTSVFFALDHEQRSKFMILLRGPYTRGEIAEKIGVKRSTIHGWETLGKLPEYNNLRAMLDHFTEWYIRQGTPGALTTALHEITGKKHLTTRKTHAKPASDQQPYPSETEH